MRNNNKYFYNLRILILAQLTSVISSMDSTADKISSSTIKQVNLDKKETDIYPCLERAKFLKKYQCSLDLEKKSDFMIAGQDYFNRLKNAPVSDEEIAQDYLDTIKYDSVWHSHRPYEIARNNPMYTRAGFFNQNRGPGVNGYIPVSGSLVDNSAPKFYIKGSSIDRIINAQRMNEYLKNKKFNNFKVAPEYLNNQGDCVIVISEQIKTTKKYKKLSLPIIKQMVQITEETGYTDWQVGYNLLEDDQGNYVFVDTENESFGLLFPSLESRTPQEWKVYALQCVARSTGTFKSHRGIDLIDDEAKSWIEMQLKKNSKQNSNQEILNFLKRLIHKEKSIIALPLNSQYDDTIGINFEQVKREFGLSNNVSQEFKKSKKRRF